MVSRFNCCMFCKVQLSLVFCSCEYCSSVTSYLVFSGHEWWAGTDCMWENSVGLWSKSSLEWASCSLILFI